jgi:hypothetical protein
VPEESEVQKEEKQSPHPPKKSRPKDLLDMLAEKDVNTGKETES